MWKKTIIYALALCPTIPNVAQKLATPTAVQYQWQERERIMFIHFGVATWLGKEYDEKGDFNLKAMNPARLNTDEWCAVAKLWGARQIIFVAKHVGGFAWWQTNTTDYSVKNIPWKNGKGDLLKDIAASCKKYGIKLGVYIYPGDVKYGAGIGSGGITKDTGLQQTYNSIFRQQLTEVLTRYGNMAEVWFDGNCKIYVDDLLKKYASKAVIFQSSMATIRWPGTESGTLAYPAWNTLSATKLKTGLATQFDDDPDGDAWAPLEADAPFYNHNWFWSVNNETRRKTLDELVNIYYKSAGYGGAMLLNCSPDSNGAVVAGDKAMYKALGLELKRRFDKPIKQAAPQRTMHLLLKLDKNSMANHVVFGEAYQEGHRIRSYEIIGINKKGRHLLVKGSSVGHKKIDVFETAAYDAIELKITKAVGVPLIRYFKAYHVAGFTFNPGVTENRDWQECGTWNTALFKNGKDTLQLLLNPFITKPGQYEIKMVTDVAVTGTSIDTAFIEIDHSQTMQQYLQRKDEATFYINRTSQISNNSATAVTFYMRSDNAVFQNRGRFFIRARK